MAGHARILLLITLIILVGVFFYLDLDAYFTFESLQSKRSLLNEWVGEYPLSSRLVFVIAYIILTALSIPVAAILTLAGGAIFGFWWGLFLVSFASTGGATLAMAMARFVFRDVVERRFKSQYEKINKGIDKEGAFYLFTLRLIPYVPFVAINLAMGLTRISMPVFFFVSQIGMLAGTIVYVNAGTQLGKLDALTGILSAELLFSFALLAVFPLLAKRSLQAIRSRRVLNKYKKPAVFDRDLIVIGAGSGGLVSALIAATLKAKVTLIEKNKMGGDCLNTGCVPSKTLIRSAKFAFDARRGESLGFSQTDVEVNIPRIMQRVQRVIKKIEPHDSIERFESLGVEVETGEGRIISPYEVSVNGKVLTTRNIVIASGAKPLVPGIKGFDQIDFLTSDNLWEIKDLPGRLVVLGGGPIGTELAQAFARLGSEVTQVEMMPRILMLEDTEISAMITLTLASEGVKVLTNHKAKECIVDGDEKFLIAETEGNDIRLPFDHLLVAVGRKASVSGFGLEDLGIALTSSGKVEVNESLQTNYPNIYAIGDVTGPYQFTHTASHMAWYASVNALLGSFWRFKADYTVIPWCTFSSPEVARVGLNEIDARKAGVAYQVTSYDVSELDRAIADEEAKGVIKVLTQEGSDRILGVTIVADHAGDLIAEYVLAMKHGLGLNKVLSTIHIYPTLAEMNKLVAGEWRKKNKPEWLLNLLQRYHRFRRGSA